MKIILGYLKDKSAELSSFLEPRVGTKPTAAGGDLEIDDSKAKEGLKAREVKTYVKRFLFRTGERKAFRVLVHGTELTLVKLEGEEKEEKEVEEEERAEKVAEVNKGAEEAPKEEPQLPAEQAKEPAEEKK